MKPWWGSLRALVFCRAWLQSQEVCSKQAKMHTCLLTGRCALCTHPCVWLLASGITPCRAPCLPAKCVAAQVVQRPGRLKPHVVPAYRCRPVALTERMSQHLLPQAQLRLFYKTRVQRCVGLRVPCRLPAQRRSRPTCVRAALPGVEGHLSSAVQALTTALG